MMRNYSFLTSANTPVSDIPMFVIGCCVRIDSEWLSYRFWKMNRERSRTAGTLGEILFMRAEVVLGHSILAIVLIRSVI